MPRVNVDRTASLGAAVNLAAGHVAEMTGEAITAASGPCPVGRAAGRAVSRAGRAWANKAVTVAQRDAARIRR